MTRKRSVFFRRVRRLLKYVQARTYRLLTLPLLLAMFLGTAILPPTFAYMVAENTIVQSRPDAQEIDRQARKLYEVERFSESASLWEQAATDFKASGDGLQAAMTLSNLSLAYQQLGQWTEASQAIAQSLNLLQARQNLGTSKERSLLLAQALDVQGRLQLALSKSQEALITWQQAANIYAQVGDTLGVTRSRVNQAQAMQALGLYRLAQQTLTETTQLLENQPDSLLKVTGLRSLGNVLRVVGDLEQSRQILQQSKEVATRVQSPQAISDALLSLGNTARAQQDTQAALEFYQQAAIASVSPATLIQSQLNQLSLLLENEQLSAAFALLPQIQSQISNLPASRMAVYARINFAQSLMKLETGGLRDSGSNRQRTTDIAQMLATSVQQSKNLKDQRAESYALGTLGGLYEQTRQLSNAFDLTQQARLLAQSIDASDIAYQWQWQLGRLLKAQGNIQQAIAAYTEAFNTLKSLRRDLVAINPEVQFSFRESVEPVYRQLVDLLLQPVGTSEPSQDNFIKAREVIEALQLAELDNFLREACLQATVEIDKVVDQENSTAVIYPIILPDRLEVILKVSQQKNLYHYSTPVAESQAESVLKELRQQLIEPDATEEVKSLSQQVYNWLIKPAMTNLAQSNVKKLVFVLDGSLRNIPMAALYDGKQYLVENYSVALTPGLHLIDPKPLKQRQLKAIVAGVSEPRSGFSALPNVKRELEEIQSEVSSKVLLNQEFTSTALQERVNSLPFPVVHLATHGQFSSQASKTFIVAWDKRIYVNELNNLLRTRDQSQPNNAIELLVLSACQTAAGDNRAALGIAGVAVRAGARSTLASLWNVDDESTALLMSQFYRELTNNQALPKAEALRRAQLALLKNPQFQRPMFWAPYILLGNWL